MVILKENYTFLSSLKEQKLKCLNRNFSSVCSEVQAVFLGSGTKTDQYPWHLGIIEHKNYRGEGFQISASSALHFGYLCNWRRMHACLRSWFRFCSLLVPGQYIQVSGVYCTYVHTPALNMCERSSLTLGLMGKDSLQPHQIIQMIVTMVRIGNGPTSIWSHEIFVEMFWENVLWHKQWPCQGQIVDSMVDN